MKGLIRNNFYSMESNVKISFTIALFLSVAAFFVKQSAFIQMIIGAQVFIFIVNVGTSLHADVVSKWNKFELTLPVKYNDIIKAKYISFVMLILFGIVMGSITAISVYVTSGLSNIQSVLYGYEFGFTLAATTAGIMYPLMLKFGTEKNELIMILSVISSIGLLVLAAAILTPLTGEMNMKHPLVGMVSTMAALGIFIGSYFISIKIYQSKEFA
ncbi:MAG: ABC-2 transporter permease [Eubacteriales bacterium]|nr:ABC-2 transporter permease [Eubacteriales bacterium]